MTDWNLDDNQKVALAAGMRLKEQLMASPRLCKFITNARPIEPESQVRRIPLYLTGRPRHHVSFCAHSVCLALTIIMADSASGTLVTRGR